MKNNVIGAVGALAVLCALPAAAQSRTPWQMHNGNEVTASNPLGLLRFSCNPTTGACVNAPVNCPAGQTCQGGSCGFNCAALNCNDGNSCTTDSCEGPTCPYTCAESCNGSCPPGSCFYTCDVSNTCYGMVC